MKNLQEILSVNKQLLQDNLKLTDKIADIKKEIEENNKLIESNKSLVFSALGIEPNEVVKLVQYEHYLCSSAYCAPFEQNVSVRSISMDENGISGFNFSRNNKKSMKRFDISRSFAILKLDGSDTVIFDNKREHDREPDRLYTEERKAEIAKGQML